MSVITLFFLKLISLWLWHVLIYLAVSGELFFPRRHCILMWSQEASFLFKYEFYFFCREIGPFLYHICYSQAQNVCLSSRFDGRTDTFCSLSLLPGLSLCLSSSLYAPRLPAPPHFVFISVFDDCGSKGFRIHNLFSLPLFTLISPLQPIFCLFYIFFS